MFSPKIFLAHAIVEAGTLVEHGGAGEIVEKEADQIEHGGGFENDGVLAGREVPAACAMRRLFRWRFRASASGSIFADVGRIGFGPAGGIRPRASVTENSARVWSCCANSPWNWPAADCDDAGGENAGGGLLGFFRHFADARRRRGRGPAGWRDAVDGEVARDFADISAAPGIGSRSGFFGWLRARLMAAATTRAQRFFVGFVGGGAGGAAVHDGADGNAEGRVRRRFGGWCCWRSA